MTQSLSLHCNDHLKEMTPQQNFIMIQDCVHRIRPFNGIPVSCNPTGYKSKSHEIMLAFECFLSKKLAGASIRWKVASIIISMQMFSIGSCASWILGRRGSRGEAVGSAPRPALVRRLCSSRSVFSLLGLIFTFTFFSSRSIFSLLGLISLSLSSHRGWFSHFFSLSTCMTITLLAFKLEHHFSWQALVFS